MREFYHDGVPDGIVPRDVEYAEKLRAATVVKGMRRTGKTFVTYERIQGLLAKGIPWGRIVHLNFEDGRLRCLAADELAIRRAGPLPTPRRETRRVRFCASIGNRCPKTSDNTNLFR